MRLDIRADSQCLGTWQGEQGRWECLWERAASSLGLPAVSSTLQESALEELEFPLLVLPGVGGVGGCWQLFRKGCHPKTGDEVGRGGYKTGEGSQRSHS